MTSIIHIDDDDDEGFDWDAAVRQIDVAFPSSNLPSTSSGFVHPPPPDTFENKKRNGASSSRQSTLDKFVVKPVSKPQPEIHNVVEPGHEKLPNVQIDAEAAKTWIYPVNVPLRDYQLAITEKALFSNTLVALPTGLGKTLIAAVVMYNYFRWFPDGKIVFTAPSRPLVTQQIEACHNIVGIPQEWTIDMTGQISPTNRACLWKSKRVFFVTPQVLEKDIQSGTCLVKYLVCLVIDEAHRAMGKFSYCVAVQELMNVPVQLRILALTATPGSKQQTIQQIIDNLHISTLEYRNESDHDVSKYVHNRKIELIQVAMGQDAVEINNKLSEVIRPYVARLCEKGVLPNRDFKTLSPCDLLNSRENFRLAPPPNLSEIMIRDMEGFFGLLITLYHIRKLLSSHGIRPAYEMLEEKLKLGSFARYMSRNEDIFKAKLIMQQSLSHGAPSPKLSKMLEVLLDHFKKNDPESSRVIIFSNFRGSVRDIMDALAKLGNIVRATQFIGQSSGKSSKGQSQKVQQAVLEKFRAGGYNVIVATSIGEEGLDIMEVDLVICFDANVSPLRMIQRMGRTGRKHDGRVVVLACEGTELKAYMRKQANSKTVGKHMRNGGMNSFNFHPSPRMVPHIYKPTVNYVQISIEKFVRSGKKIKDDGSMTTPLFKENLTDAESNLVNKYFHPPGGITWKPSLIAFPHFQTFPSRVHKVMHSFKTGLLIDAMQRVQGLSFASDSKSSLMEDEVGFERGFGLENVEHDNEEDLQSEDYPSQHNMEATFLRPETSPTQTIETNGRHSACDLPHQSPDGHSCLFGPDFVSVDTFGNILILSVPLLTSKGVSHMNHTSESSTALHSLDRVSCHLKNVEDKVDTTAQAGGLEDVMIPQKVCMKYGSPYFLSGFDALKGKSFDGIKTVSHTPSRNLQDEDNLNKTPDAEMKASLIPDEYSNDSRDNELSPRLTNMIKSGVVPESPTDNNGLSNCKDGEAYLSPNLLSPAQLHNEIPFKSSNPEKNKIVNMESDNCGRNVSFFPIDNAVQTPSLYKDNSASMRGCTHMSPILDKSYSPLPSPRSGSCSKDWCLSIADKSESVKPTRKFKRLRKVGNEEKNENLWRGQDSSFNPRARLEKLFAQHKSGKKKPANNAIRDFIEEEAEVSVDSDMSDDEDEDDDQYNNSHDSFIDDRTSPTLTATQSAISRTDMMAIYRRSLLSQSPMPGFPIGSATHSSHSTALTTRTRETGSWSIETSSSFRTPPTESANLSTNSSKESKQIHMKSPSSETVPCTTGVSSSVEIDYGGRKRKLSFNGPSSSSIPTLNLEREFELQYEAAGGSEAPRYYDKNNEMVCDDEFYEGLDLDEVEAQATLLLKQKAESQRREVITPYIPPENPSSPSMPTFDLGI
ncbi:DEAD-box ATP-dependent RNA helicase FANCM isoform X2 [Humulus lupulus]|uniref:DEAD-box ATP-dependent RNA helicase FANCM isoform X2 n=1 Tax=Humulus lupulus TaxID=3486 RepID=UPI002B40D148|nr:DEAD-box ATP-dependent RNA helicase FANCM isoform X2 [Humulus lupulus]